MDFKKSILADCIKNPRSLKTPQYVTKTYAKGFALDLETGNVISLEYFNSLKQNNSAQEAAQ